MFAANIASLDDAPPLELDAAIFQCNIEALRREQADFAARIEACALPGHWRAVRGLDGFATWRIESPGEAPHWLDHSAAPRTRAVARLADFDARNQNVALPGISVGAELTLLLERLSQLQAAYVFEPDVKRLAAVLRTLNLAAAISASRCILVPFERPLEMLRERLSRHSGLLPPGKLISMPGVDPNVLNAAQSCCETIAREIHAARQAKLSEILQATVASKPRGVANTITLTVLALGGDPIARAAARDISAAAGRMNWNVTACTASGPYDAHPLAHAEKLAGIASDIVLCVGHDRSALPLSLSGHACQWYVDRYATPPANDEQTLHLAASPAIANDLKSAGVPAARIAPLYWAVATDTPNSLEEAADKNGVFIVADRPRADARSCGIVQPTHRALWAALGEHASKAWQTDEITQPERLLGAAERTSGVILGDRDLRGRMLRLIELVLIPATVVERILRSLSQESCELRAIGKGWSDFEPEVRTVSVTGLSQCDSDTWPTRPRAAIFAGAIDSLRPDLLAAVARGWPVFVHSPTRRSAALGGVLHAEQHFVAFSGTKDLREQLRAAAADPAAALRRCRRARAHLLREHTYEDRLEALVNRFELPLGGRTQ